MFLLFCTKGYIYKKRDCLKKDLKIVIYPKNRHTLGEYV